MGKKVKVLVVDDSAIMRKMLCDALAKNPLIEVVGTAGDPYEARERILQLNPDLLTLDLDLPRMDGISFLKLLQQHRPMPVVVISSHVQPGSPAALAALDAGATDLLEKPDSVQSVTLFADRLGQRILMAFNSRLGAELVPSAPPAIDPSPGLVGARTPFHPRQIICIGSSTGGVEAITEVLTKLPDHLPGIVIAQHIQPQFSRILAERLSGECSLEVREGADGDALRPGLVLIAPGDYHMTVGWTDTGYRVALNRMPAVHHCRPAVDVLFQSVGECPGARVVAAILTGMGSDGAQGMKALKAKGARTIAQDEASCVVYGMPRAAVELGVVDRVLPLSQIAGALCESAIVMAGLSDARPAVSRTY